MKERISYIMWIYELTFEKINLDRISNVWLRVPPALMLFPILFCFIFLGLLIEEPIKSIVLIICLQSSPKKEWNFHKNAWRSLFQLPIQNE